MKPAAPKQLSPAAPKQLSPEQSAKETFQQFINFHQRYNSREFQKGEHTPQSRNLSPENSRLQKGSQNTDTLNTEN